MENDVSTTALTAYVSADRKMALPEIAALTYRKLSRLI